MRLFVLRMEKVPVSYSPKWWLDGDLSLHGKEVKNHLKQIEDPNNRLEITLIDV